MKYVTMTLLKALKVLSFYNEKKNEKIKLNFKISYFGQHIIENKGFLHYSPARLSVTVGFY